MLRYFCVVAPGKAGDTSYDYLEAITRTGAKIRALPIGATRPDIEKRWWRVGGAFTELMSLPYVNVVCSPPGMLLGQTIVDVATVFDVMVDKNKNVTRPSVAYEPKTAFTGLYTIGVTNIAIVDLQDGGAMPDAHEREAIAKYEHVLCPTMAGAMVLRAIGIPARAISSNDITLAQLEELCGSAITVTGASSTGSVAPPATISLPSTALAPSSRSPSSVTRSPAPSRGIRNWIASQFRSIKSLASRTWRSITRRFGRSGRF